VTLTYHTRTNDLLCSGNYQRSGHGLGMAPKLRNERSKPRVPPAVDSHQGQVFWRARTFGNSLALFHRPRRRSDAMPKTNLMGFLKPVSGDQGITKGPGTQGKLPLIANQLQGGPWACCVHFLILGPSPARARTFGNSLAGTPQFSLWCVYLMVCLPKD
jgi:hypothetical protein